MTNYNFFHHTEVRYGDLDPQGHVNNAKYLTYFEQARIYYTIALGLFHKDQSFMEVGVIVADIHVAYHKPTHYGDNIQVGVRSSKVGNKSITVEQCVMNKDTGEILASGTVILVAFDYKLGHTIPVPENWRTKLAEFEGI